MTKKTLLTAILAATVVSAFMTPVYAVECTSPTQKNCSVTVRDSRGVKVGTQERGYNGTTTVRDSRGIKQGTIQTQPGRPSCEIIRDSRGVKVGTRGKC